MGKRFESNRPNEGAVVNETVDDLIFFAESVLEDGQLESSDLRDELLHKLYSAVAINNSGKARELIKYIENRYGETEPWVITLTLDNM